MTTLMRRNPFEELINRFPHDLFGGDRAEAPAIEWSPRCDVTETDEAILVHAELPGVDVAHMDVTVAEGILTLRGEKTTERKEETEKRSYSERFFGSFERSITIPAGIDESAIQATLKDGVLEVRVPKMEVVKAAARKVEIKQP